MTNRFETTLEYAKKMDQDDELKGFKEHFYIKEGYYYLDGNSLGLLSKYAEKTLLSGLDSWKQYGIDGWTEGEEPWFYFAEKLGEMSAELIGAAPEEVIVTGSTTVNLHQLVSTFYKPEGNRTKILADSLTFPSDIYALKSQLTLHGYDPKQHLILVESKDGVTLDEDDIIEQMTEEVALIVLPSVLYRSGQLLNLEKLTKAAKNRGILIGFDLAHSMGSVPHTLSEQEVDFAFWCNYKYLNAGPGSVGGIYVNKKHFGTNPGLLGWFGSNKDSQFDMSFDYVPATSAGAFQIGTPHILSMAPLLGSLEMFKEAGIGKIREKSLKLTDYLMKLIETELADTGFTIVNPKESSRRGGHVSLMHDEAIRICKALKDEQVIPDFRSPNMIRLAPIALYSSFEDVWHSVSILKDILVNKKYERYENKRNVIA